ncbi:MAG: putative O-glycosylation ligase, exosortase A system-associated [Novosphingobium sp.]|nr:putative O-glycosylation ligase, exosortase A system-associated [Novosphingobium sp.]
MTPLLLELGLAGFLAAMLALGLRRPFVWVLAYIYIDIVGPQKISYMLLASVPVSLIVFLAAFGGWLLLDNKQGSRFGFRQFLLLVLLAYCGYTTLGADYPEAAAIKWGWVWKALVFAIFLPLTLHTRLRLEATTLVMVLSAASIIITGGIKTALGGGGYGSLQFFVNDNTGLYEGSIISCVAIAIIPLIVWLVKHGTVFPDDKRVRVFAAALIFACLLIPVGTQARTGLVCIAVLGVLLLRTVRRRFLYMTLIGAAGMLAIPFLPQSFTERMSTIENHQADESASTRLAVWQWTWEYARDHPFGGGFDAYRGNKISYNTRTAETSGSNVSVEFDKVTDEGRAYHSSYFEMLGEQGWPGLLLWLWLQGLGILHMEVIRRRWKDRTGKGEQWQAPLASALQQAQIIYLVGAAFVGIAYQPFILMLVGIQCALWSYLKRLDFAAKPKRPPTRTLNPVAPVATA